MSRVSMTWPQYQRQECTFDGRTVWLTPKEAEVLSTLLLRRGMVTHQSILFDALYPPDPDGGPVIKIIDVWICKVRRKLPGLIETVHGQGVTIPVPA